MKSFSDFIELILFVSAGFILRLLPYRAASKSGELLGRLLYVFDKKHRKVAYDNLKPSFPEKNDEEIQNIIKKLYGNLGRIFAEFLWSPRYNEERIRKIVKITGIENLKSALAKKKGVLVVTSHFGNWEMMGMVFPLLLPSSAIAFPQSNKATDRLINKYRETMGIRVIETGRAAKEIFKLLKKNEGVGLLADQDADDQGVFVDFFGRPASTNRGPVVLALKTKAPLIMAFPVRQPQGRYELIIEKEIEVADTGNVEEDVKVNTQRWSRVLEGYIRKYPEQWFWVHRRWKSKPREVASSK